MTFSYHTITFVVLGTLLWKMRAIQTRVVWNTNAIPFFTWIQMKHTQLFKDVPQPTTKKWETHYKGVSIIFNHVPTIDTKKKCIFGELLTILHLHLEIGKAWFMNGPACIFSGHWHQSLFRQKLKEREKARNMELECGLDCNLNRENN